MPSIAPRVDFAAVFAAMSGALLVLSPDADATVVAVNVAAAQLLGTEPDALMGRPLFAVVTGLFPSEQDIASLRDSSHRTRGERTTQASRVAGRRVVFSPVFGQPEGALDSILLRLDPVADADESDRERLMYEAALSNTPDLVYIFDRAHRFVYANDALLAMWGKTKGDSLGKTCLELGYEPWHAAMHDREIEQVVATKRPIRGEVPFTGTNGRRIYDYIFVPVLNAAGDVVAIAGSTRDITDRQRDEEALREQAKRLEEADRAKDEFLATLSHELRNPLAPLRTSLSLLRSTQADAATVNRLHATMDRQVDHLVRLVDDLLEVSRINTGTFALRNAPTNLAEVLDHAIENCAGYIDRARHSLNVIPSSQPLIVDGDAVRLVQIIGNLIHNAAKYTPAGGRIEVEAFRRGDEAVIVVRDNGNGIAPTALPRIFEMFNRAGRPSRDAQGGLGVGLTLAHKLIAMHGGTLEAASEGLARGSVFTVRLPTPSAAPPPMPATSAESASSVQRKRLLLVDDNVDAADMLGMLLANLGVEVRIVYDGASAISEFEAFDPAVVLLDIGMPGMNGYEVARTLRARFPERRARLVALTGWGQDTDRRRAYEEGFDQHMVKPAELPKLRALLESV